jgi:mRNA-degrading endonuclease toxin of MazEF toxin-antitoxin module
VADRLPQPGLVIPYSYLWRREHEAGEETGRKHRPCVVVIALRRSRTGRPRVAVVPVTSREPDANRAAIRLPQRVKSHLGLDTATSWVICDEFNEFDWPSPDIGSTMSGRRSFGYVPDPLIELLRAELLAARQRGALKGTYRPS